MCRRGGREGEEVGVHVCKEESFREELVEWKGRRRPEKVKKSSVVIECMVDLSCLRVF